MCNNPKQANGFTLLELIITIAIVGILMAMAIPSFQDLMRNNRLTTYANEMVTAINIARSEAIKRNKQVTIRRKSATSSVWESGWEVFVDNTDIAGNVKGTRDGTDELLRDYPALKTGYTLRTGGNITCWVSYKPDGTTDVKNDNATCTNGSFNNPRDTFRVCDDIANTANGRAIALNIIGRARATKGTASCP